MQGFFLFSNNLLYNNIVIQTRQTMALLIEKPIPPADDDCCGGGACNPCVWDPYYAELQKWRIEQARIKEQKTQNSVT